MQRTSLLHLKELFLITKRLVLTVC